jgi:Dipeptidyl aminopeptidases/acylaminoacyl-peptidases
MKFFSTLISAMLLVAFSAQGAEDVKVKQYKYSAPYTVNYPIMVDSIDVKGKGYNKTAILKTALSTDKAFASYSILDADTAGKVSFTTPETGQTIRLLSFYLNSDRYLKGTLSVESNGEIEVMVDKKTVSKSAELTLEPRSYEIIIKHLSAATDTFIPTIKTVFSYKGDAVVTADVDANKRYTLKAMTEGTDFTGATISADGKSALVRYSVRLDGGKSERYTQLVDVATGKVRYQGDGNLNSARWMPSSNAFFYTRTGYNGRELVKVDAVTLQETILATSLPENNPYFSPDERTVFFMVQEKGPKEDGSLNRVLEPADRIPGFRDRSLIWRYDLTSGIYEQLTFGYHSTFINDISLDSRYLLFSTSERVYTSLPHSRNSLFKLDLQTMAVDTIWSEAKYINQSSFSPDGKQLLVSAAAPAFNGLGENILEGQIENTYDGQLFIYDLATSKAKALTKDFDPSVSRAVWNRTDNNIYILCEDEDYINLYTCNPKTGAMKKIETGEDVIVSYSLAATAPTMIYYGQSVSNANRLYSYNLKNNRRTLMNDLSASRLKDIKLGEVHDWNFTSADGTDIQGRYYLPPNFDSTKKYPMIVYYYGGTAPTNRMLEMRYSMHLYAALGYVVYTLNPSGTTGFGQEFAARHVNAWGKVTADEIILGTELFCKEHSFVDASKIGCIGASYGGFMTQYLQTRTDIFAAAISHAGISSISSYWGEGYWGWGYCAVANTGSYPWNNPELFVEQSPLFKADKINTPLLLLHGGVDTNVPVGESIQMFTALKLLGKTVEFVQVEGENHGIVGYNKRIGWKNSIYAWFAKWLKDEPEWWDELYPERKL